MSLYISTNKEAQYDLTFKTKLNSSTSDVLWATRVMKASNLDVCPLLRQSHPFNAAVSSIYCISFDFGWYIQPSMMQYHILHLWSNEI
jgi:hypothetical protein